VTGSEPAAVPADAGVVPWRELLAATEQRLADAAIASPSVDARRLVEEASGLEGAALILGLDEAAPAPRIAHLDALVARRVAGEPLQYVLGRWAFRSLDLLVDRRVLIPRPETEQVCDLALAELDRFSSAHRSGGEPVPEGGPVVADLGAGSGALGLAMAVERPGTEVWAVELSPDAAEVCRANVAALGRAASRVHVVEGSWFDALPDAVRGGLAVVVSNPPYVAAGDPLPADVADWEPATALVPGPTGLEDIARLVADAPGWLAPGGALVVEIGETQGTAVAALAREAGFSVVEIRPDHNRRDRALVARL
jgi:release factor glutamine methyltransferase